MSNQKFAKYPSLHGRPVIISGGATGIGAAFVRDFAEQGSKVGFIDINGEAGRALADDLNARGHRVAFETCDVADIENYQGAIAKFADKHGPARALLNNAANDQRHEIEQVSPDDWDHSIAVNLKHAYFATQAVAPGMKAAGGGSVINLGSVSWMTLASRLSTYATAKAAMHGMSRSLARDLGQHGIRVNTLVPGWVMTDRQLKLWVTAEGNKQIDENQALKGRVLPSDISRMALFLAADDSQMISAQNFIVDGGWAN